MGDGRDAGQAAAADATASTPRRDASGPSGEVQLLLQHWQATADHDAFAHLVHVVAPTVAEVAKRVLLRRGIRDPGAVEDAVSLVLDHLRRLAAGSCRERSVMPFDAGRAGHGNAGDAGAAYVVWLARERAADVARRTRRQWRHAQPLDDHFAARLAACPESAADDDERAERLQAAIERLPIRDRVVCDLLLTGRSQATIAALLGLCAGSVSRIRQRVIAVLRESIAEL